MQNISDKFNFIAEYLTSVMVISYMRHAPCKHTGQAQGKPIYIIIARGGGAGADVYSYIGRGWGSLVMCFQTHGYTGYGAAYAHAEEVRQGSRDI